MEFQIKGVKTSHDYNTFLMHKFRIKEGENEEVYSITQKFCIQIFHHIHQKHHPGQYFYLNSIFPVLDHILGDVMQFFSFFLNNFLSLSFIVGL